MEKDPDHNSTDPAEIEALITRLERGQLRDEDAVACPAATERDRRMKEGIDYKQLCHRIITLWRDDNVPLNAGATKQELSEFEAQFELTFPPDFRYFYSQVNGMPDLESDARLFSLWPLSRMIQEVNGIIFDRTFTPPRVEIAFGDFLIDSHRFYLRRDEHGRFSVTSQIIKGENLADDFTQFLAMYLSGSDKLGLF